MGSGRKAEIFVTLPVFDFWADLCQCGVWRLTGAVEGQKDENGVSIVHLIRIELERYLNDNKTNIDITI